MTLQKTSKPVTKCQLCESADIKSVLFIGFIPPVNTMPPVGKPAEEQSTYPLELLRCNKCTLVQIGCEVDPGVLFPPEYPYLSGTTRILRENFAELYQEVKTFKKLSEKSLCIDIGSNDGTLLGNFHQGGHRVLGIEPSNASKVANSKGILTKMAFFSENLAKEVRAEFGPASVVTAANCFAHIPNVHGIVRGIVTLLDQDGIFISENHYLGGLVETVQYDTVYHEHLRYYSLHALKYLFDQNGLEIFNVKKIPTHGGSIRVYTARKGQCQILPSVQKILDEETKMGLTDGRALDEFRERVVNSKVKFYSLLEKVRKPGTRIYGIGAPSRSSTLINYLGLDDDIMQAVMEVKDSHKLNKYVPGTRIPVLDEANLYKDQPEFALLLSWHIATELAPKIRAAGFKGQFIVPLPVPHILEM